MALTNLKKNAKGYSYKYTDLAQVHDYLESQGITYYQFIERIGDDDYIYTVPIINGEEKNPRRGCRVAQATLKGVSNPAQEQGSAITYARRYSLLMAFGLATTDDDAQCMSRPKDEAQEAVEKATTVLMMSKEEQIKFIRENIVEGTEEHKKLMNYCKGTPLEKMSDASIMALYNNCVNKGK